MSLTQWHDMDWQIDMDSMENRVGTLFACIGTDKLNSKVMTRQELIKKYGMDEFNKIAKKHFANYKEVTE